MRAVSFEKLISKSLERTGTILLRPFSAKKWSLLLFIAFLAGSLNGGGGGGFNFNFPCKAKKGEAAVERTQAPAAGVCPLKAAGDAKDRLLNFLCAPGMLRWLVVLAGLALVFVLVMMWLCARFNFVWIEAILKNDASVREPFRRYKKEGDSLFNFFVNSTLLFLAAIGLLVWWGFNAWYSVAGLDKKACGYVGTVIAAFAGPAAGFLAALLAFILVWFFVEHFVITVMALDKCSFVPAWRSCCGIFSKNTKDFFVYLLVIIVAGVASAVLAGIASIALIIVLALAAAVLFGLPYLLFVFILKAKILFLVWALAAGIPFGACSLVLLAALGLPFAVFFRNLSFYFLSSLQSGYEPLGLS